MPESLDPIIATLAVVLGLSLVVQGLQQIFKQWLDLKSNYMRLQLLAMFDSTQMVKNFKYCGLGRANSQAGDADPLALSVVKGIESALKSYGYKDLELLQEINTKDLKKIVGAIDWRSIPGAEEVAGRLSHINEDIENWFGLAKKAFQDLYERRMKVWSFFTSLVVVVALNANLFSIYSQFTSNVPLRNAAISWAEKSVATPEDATTSSASLTDEELVSSIRSRVDSMRQILKSDGFQVLGWGAETFKATSSPGWISNWLANVVGWILMTFLVSLGAPFWYDVLKTIMGLKEKMKPSATPQKTPEEEESSEGAEEAETPAVG
jgi:hypothetical protein